MIWGDMMSITRKSDTTALFIVATLLFLPALHAADNSIVTLTATIGKGTCAFATNTDAVEFAQPQIISDFHAGNAVATQLFQLSYHCEGYENNSKATLSVSGATSSDNRVFLSNTSTAEGVGFMLKDGTVTALDGFYNAGTTLKNGDTLLVDAVTSGEHALSIGFVKQNGSLNVTSGAVNAAVTFTFAVP